MKTIRDFRIEKEVWEKFKEECCHAKPTRLIREFVHWYLKYNDLWLPVKHAFLDFPSCFLCNKRFEATINDKELRGLQALSGNFRVLLVVSKAQYGYRDYDVQTRWICGECFSNLEKSKASASL